MVCDKTGVIVCDELLFAGQAVSDLLVAVADLEVRERGTYPAMRSNAVIVDPRPIGLALQKIEEWNDVSSSTCL